MNKTLKAVIIQLSDGNVRNSHINLRGADGLFPESAFGGSNASAAGRPITVHFGRTTASTDINKTKAIFRERAAVREFFEIEKMAEGDLVVIERLKDDEFQVWKTSKRAVDLYL